MKLEKAITILTIHNDHNPNYTDAERQEAHQLGIEGLKREKLYRWPNGNATSRDRLLPGETLE